MRNGREHYWRYRRHSEQRSEGKHVHPRRSSAVSADCVRDRNSTAYALEHAPVAIAILDRNLCYLHVNDRFRDDFELGDLDVTGLNHFDVFTPLAEPWKPVCERCLAGAVERGQDDPIERCAGRIDYVRWECRPWFDQGGGIGGVVLYFELVTERKKIEDKLLLTQYSVDSAADEVFWINEDGRFTYVNEAVCQCLGYSREDLLQKRVSDIDSNYPQVRWPGLWAEMKRRGTFFLETCHIARDGRRIPVEVSGRLLEFKGQGYVYAFARDITERKRARESLERRNRQLDALSQASRKLNSVLEFPVIMETLVASALELVEAESGAVGRYLDGKIVIADYFVGTEKRSIDLVFEPGYGVPGWVLENKRTYVSNAVDQDPNVIPTIRKLLNFYNIISVPILDRQGEILGCFKIHNKKGHRPFDEQDIVMLEGLAASAAIAFENTRILGERTKAETRLKESERRLTDIISFLPDATFVVDRDGRVLFWNQSLEILTGVKAEAVIGKTSDEFSQTLYGQSRPLLIDSVLNPSLDVAQYYSSYQKIGDTLTAEGCVPKPHCEDVSYIWIKASPLYDADGTIIGAIESIRNVDERKQAEERLKDSERRLADIINFLPDATFVVDREGRVIAWNRAIEDLTKIPARDILGKNDDEYALPFYGKKRPLLVDCAIHPDVVPEDFYSSVEREGEILVAEVYFPAFMGRRTYFWVKATPLRDSHGKLVGGIEAVRDTTARKLAEEELRQLNEELEKRVEDRTHQLELSNQELEAFSYSVSHDLRAPLRSITGFSQILVSDYQECLDESGQDYLRRVVEAGQRMGQLIDDLLGLSRVTRREMVRTTVDLSGMARAILADRMAAEPDRRVEVSIAPNIQANGDPGFLRIVMENLLGNAWKFTAHHPSARIEFGMQPRHDRREYVVRDNGAGFDMKTAGKLFAPFQRLHREEEFPGTGIGLATVQRIIHRHGGCIRAEGEVEKGATFYFTLGADDRLR